MKLTQKARIFVLCLGLGVGGIGCAGSLTTSTQVLKTTAVVVNATAKAFAAGDRAAQEAIVSASRAGVISVDAAQGRIAAYREQRKPVLAMVGETGTTLASVKTTLDALPAEVTANDAAVDAELASLER